MNINKPDGKSDSRGEAIVRRYRSFEVGMARSLVWI